MDGFPTPRPGGRRKEATVNHREPPGTTGNHRESPPIDLRFPPFRQAGGHWRAFSISRTLMKSSGASSPPGGFSLFGAAINRPVAVTMLMAGVILFGLVAYSRLQLALMPRFSHPTLTVRTAFPGSAPEEVEQFVTLPLEKQLSIISGLNAVRSRSRAGISEVMLEFQWGTDLGLAALEVREKMDRLFLPEGVEPPQMLRFDPDDEPILRLALLSSASPGKDTPRGASLESLRRLATDELKPRLTALNGVASVSVRGGSPLEVVVSLDEKQLGRHGLSVARVAERLREEHINLAGGALDEGRLEYRVRTLNELTGLEQIGAVALSPPGRPLVRLRDVATIRFEPGRQEVHTLASGRPAVEIEVFKEADANVVQVAKTVRHFLWGPPPGKTPPSEASRLKKGERPKPRPKRRVRRGGGRGHRFGGRPAEPKIGGALREMLAPGMEARLVHDQSRFIEAALAEVRRTALLGGALAVGVLFLFLGGLRATGLVVVAIPLSILATFLPMFFWGTTLNLISMGGLALGIGMLVDNSIVVLEAIHRLREQGLSPPRAALEGLREVGGAVTASTLTTIAVFLPMTFVEGVAGEIIGDLAITVVFSLLASLVVAVLVLPALTTVLSGTVVMNGTVGMNGTVVLSGTVVMNGTVDPPPDGGGRPAGFGIRAWETIGAMSHRWRDEAAALIAGPLMLVTLLFPYRAVRFLTLSAWLLLAIVVLLGVAIWAGGWGLLGRLIAPLALPVHGALAGFRRGVVLATVFYRRILERALARPGRVVALAALAFVISLAVARQLPQGLLPSLHQGILQVRLEYPAGTSLAQTTERITAIERELLALPGVARTFTRIGESPDDPVPEQGGDHIGIIWVEAASAGLSRGVSGGVSGGVSDDVSDGGGAEAEARLAELIRRRLAMEPGLVFTIEPPPLFSLKPPLTIEIQGERLADLQRFASQVEAKLRTLPQLREVQSLQQAGKPELQVIFNREALSRHGLSAREVAERIRSKLQGDTPVRFRTAQKRLVVRVRVSRLQLDSVDKLASLVINPGQTTPLPLSAVATLREGVGPAEIRHISQRRTALVNAGLSGGDLKGAREAIVRALDGLQPPPGITYRLGGQGQEMQRSLRSLALALVLAVFLVYLVMASQFESVVEPFVILFSVPLAG
ncbi:MAG: efflux RND transporter permease subunit, partial [SAR324 cluster bacterium]|nr:efflux RND transporter permease subunit [SAR324 cluster bacterium]